MSTTTVELKRPIDCRFTNKKFFAVDFSNMDLNNADFRSCTLHECNFENSDLTKAVFKGANCYGANFKGTIMHRTNFEDAILSRSVFDPKRIFGVTITMTCDTFEKVKIGRTAWLYWLFMPLLMEAPDKEIAERLITAIGKDNYEALSRVFKEAII